MPLKFSAYGEKCISLEFLRTTVHMHNTYLKYNTVMNTDLLTTFTFISPTISSVHPLLQTKVPLCSGKKNFCSVR